MFDSKGNTQRSQCSSIHQPNGDSQRANISSSQKIILSKKIYKNNPSRLTDTRRKENRTLRGCNERSMEFQGQCDVLTMCKLSCIVTRWGARDVLRDEIF